MLCPFGERELRSLGFAWTSPRLFIEDNEGVRVESRSFEGAT